MIFIIIHLRMIFIALDELGLSQVHTLIISFPYSADSKVAMMHPIWKEAELLAQEGMFQVAGVADLDKEKLAELYEWASNKPKVNQVNLAHCCTIPEVWLYGCGQACVMNYNEFCSV